MPRSSVRRYVGVACDDRDRRARDGKMTGNKMEEVEMGSATFGKVPDRVSVRCGRLLEGGELRGVIGLNETGGHCSNVGCYILEMPPFSIYVCGVHRRAGERHLEKRLIARLGNSILKND